jgi:hypothetical protein
LKDSIYLAQIAEEINNIKRRYLINQIGGARPNTRSVSAQNQVLNAPVRSGMRSHSSTAAASGGNDNSRNRGNQAIELIEVIGEIEATEVILVIQ